MKVFILKNKILCVNLIMKILDVYIFLNINLKVSLNNQLIVIYNSVIIILTKDV